MFVTEKFLFCAPLPVCRTLHTIHSSVPTSFGRITSSLSSSHNFGSVLLKSGFDPLVQVNGTVHSCFVTLCSAKADLNGSWCWLHCRFQLVINSALLSVKVQIDLLETNIVSIALVVSGYDYYRISYLMSPRFHSLPYRQAISQASVLQEQLLVESSP